MVKNILILALAVVFVLLLPLIAMQFSDDVDWSPFDFAFAGALLFGTGLAYLLVVRKADNLAYRAAVSLALAAALLLIWINLAVGIIGSEDNPANGLYLGVLAIFMIGALIARFRPHGMALALFATALAQAIVTVIALIIWKPEITSVQALLDVLKVLALNAFFVTLWVGSALLFLRASVVRLRRTE